MRIIQKLIFILTILIAIVWFFYTLSFSSGWALGQPLGTFFTEAQIANKILFKWGLWAVIFSTANLIMNTHSNRKFFLLNYLFILLTIGCFIGSGIKILEVVPPLKILYSELSEGMLFFITTFNYSEIGTNVFDFGVAFSYVLFAQAFLVTVFTIIKSINQIKRAKIKRNKKLEASL